MDPGGKPGLIGSSDALAPPGGLCVRGHQRREQRAGSAVLRTAERFANRVKLPRVRLFGYLIIEMKYR